MAEIVGSPIIEAYRKLLLKIVNELRREECKQIAFLAKLSTPTCYQEAGQQYDNIRLHFMSTLESLGHIGPLILVMTQKHTHTLSNTCYALPPPPTHSPMNNTCVDLPL